MRIGKDEGQGEKKGRKGPDSWFYLAVRAFLPVRPAAHVSNRCKSGIRPVVCKEKVKCYFEKFYI